MPITVVSTGAISGNVVSGVTETTHYRTYSYFSGYLTSTDNYSDNKFDFGGFVKELWIYNTGGNPIAFQFKELWPISPQKDSGIVWQSTGPNQPERIYFRELIKSGIAIRSANPGNSSTFYVIAI